MRSILAFLLFSLTWFVASTSYAQTAPAESGQGACWTPGHVCWDDDGDSSCHLNCCSKQYHQDPKLGKDVCDAPKACWAAGTKCWDDLGQNSCKLNCCAGTWHEDSAKGYDVCNAPPALKPAVVGYGGAVDEQMRQTLTIGTAACWGDGAKCWNNRGTDSCVDNCCSKSYRHDAALNADVCTPIPADKKCYAQYTPCWDSNPPPNGAKYVDSVTGKTMAYPSCFNCCARISRNGSTRWPAWTEYYVGDGTHDATSAKTKWSDALVAGLKGLNPVQGFIDAMKAANASRTARGGRPPSKEVQQSLNAGYADYAADQAAKNVAKTVALAAVRGATRNPAGIVFNFLFDFISTLVSPQWDLCD